MTGIAPGLALGCTHVAIAHPGWLGGVRKFYYGLCICIIVQGVLSSAAVA
jgi:hypothetical protein